MSRLPVEPTVPPAIVSLGVNVQKVSWERQQQNLVGSVAPSPRVSALPSFIESWSSCWDVKL